MIVDYIKKLKEDREPLFLLERVTKIYPPYFKALFNINLRIEKGDFVVIYGDSGSGKSTLLKILYKEELPTIGNIFFSGISYEKLSEKNFCQFRKKWGIVFQDLKLFEDLTVYQNLSISLKISEKVSQKEEKFKILEHLEKFDLVEKAERKIKELSFGEKQKINLIRAFLKEPEVFIMDEPFSFLDEKTQKMVLNLMSSFKRKGATFIVTCHKAEAFSSLSPKIYGLKKGELVEP